VVDAAVFARKVAAIRDAVARIRDVFPALAERGTIDSALGDRLRAAAGLRNLVAHQYGVLDFTRVHAVARGELGDLLLFCEQLTARIRG